MGSRFRGAFLLCLVSDSFQGRNHSSMRRAASAVSILVVLGFSYPAAAQLKSLETEDLRLVYIDPSHTYLTPHVARSFESRMAFYKEFFDYEPSERVTVKLMDVGDVGGGSAGVLPTNNLTVRIAPLSFAFETMPPGERLTTIMNHELLHLVSMDQAAGSDVRFRRLFHGKVLPTADHPETLAYLYLTTPRVAVPAWYQEGGAVFMETWMAGGLGRAQGAYDEMVFRSMVKDGTHFYDPLGLVSEGIKIDFQVGMNSYLYGTRFMSYLAYHYSPEAVVGWIARKEGTRKYYAAEFKHAFGMPIRDAWRDWIDWEHEFQRTNLDAIRKNPTTPYRDLSARALGSVSSAFFDSNTREIFAAFNYPGVVAHVGSISVDDGTVKKLVEVKAPVIYTVTSLAYDADQRKIFFTTDNSAYRDLHVLDPDSGKTKRLMKDQRIGDLAFNRVDGSLWGVRYLNGYTTLVRIPAPHTDWYQVHTWPALEVIYDIDVSPDGRLLSASVAKINGRHSVCVFDLEKLALGDATPVTQFDLDGTIVNDFVFSPDGRYLYGSSYISGVSNIIRYELATEQIEAVTNTETGFFRPIPLGDDELIVFRYTGEGLVPAQIEATPLDIGPITLLGHQVAEKHPVIRDWVPGSPRDVPLESIIQRDDDYRAIHAVKLESIYPVVEGYKDSQALGFSANFSDPMFLNRFSLTASYSPDRDLLSEERTHIHFKYYRASRPTANWEVNLKWNDADFYDLFGPTKISRKGYSAGFAYNKSLLYDLPRQLDLHLDATYYADMDQMPRFQNIAADIDSLVSGRAQLSYNNLRASLGAVDFEKGLRVDAWLGAKYIDGDLIPVIVTTFDFGFALPWRHSSIWLRSSAGATSGDLADPFANFYFGGFGNNWVDHGSSKHYRGFYSFAGTELNEIAGRNFVKTMLEWNLPPLRFRQAGTPGFFLTWARASLFAGGIDTNLDDSSVERKIGNAGAQIDFRFTVLSKFKMTLSLGYAVAFEDSLGSSDEFMFSLNVLN